jgi:hypothetical protein
MRRARGALLAVRPVGAMDPRQRLGPEPLAGARFPRRGAAQRGHAATSGGAGAHRRARALVQRPGAPGHPDHLGHRRSARRAHPAPRRWHAERRPRGRGDGPRAPRHPRAAAARGGGDAAPLVAGARRRGG